MEKPKLIFASNNKGKIRELKQLLGDIFDVQGMQEAGLDFDIAETGETFLQNALIKARAVFDAAQTAAIADDSGLCVDALGGEPGVMSARYIADHDNDANTDEVLRRMENQKNRKAHFECAIAMIDQNGREITACGRVDGSVTHKREGSGGFGYDPIFFSDELGESFGNASQERKNKVSHRARALDQLLKRLRA